jgi:hypothetical protein
MIDSGDKRKMIKLIDSNSINMVSGGETQCCCHGPDSADVLGVDGVADLCDLVLGRAQGASGYGIYTSINGRTQEAVIISSGIDAAAAAAGASTGEICVVICGYKIPTEQPGTLIRYSTLGRNGFWSLSHFSVSLQFV